MLPLFLPLLAGGTAVLAPGTPSPAALRELVAEHRTDTLALTPSHLTLFGAAGSSPTHGLRTLLLGGEPLTPTAVRSAHAAFGADCRVINAYGPTEATVAVLAHTVDGGETGATVPIGLPGPYAQVDLVTDGETIGSGPDDTGRTGEIVVRGVQVARGYLGPSDGRPSPFTTGPDGVRVYRTGDLGRRLADGSVEFAGRIDEQVKIAGHRVDPAEVVAALEAHTAVHRAVVVPRRRPHSTAAVLCAYVLPETTVDPAVHADLARALRTELTRTLPAYLVPAHVAVIDTLPSTVSGKADLDALPDPFAHTTPAAPLPVTLEARVRHHWAEILGVDGALLSADSDFHALGGDSLALVEMVTAVSSDLLTPGQAQRFTGRLDCLVRNLTFEQVCEHLTAAREEAAA
ncbi:non-ribosomal peptide synthetase [Streptomyces sp. MS1.HAVA.3]|uniref:Non-ribosomal peptide synthetase n=1 Tax=Streptomyces caledonius TaxID=3134107 RepID=A0ABU8UE57_9ACTN